MDQIQPPLLFLTAGESNRRAVYRRRRSSAGMNSSYMLPFHLTLNSGVRTRRMSPPSSSLSGGFRVGSTDGVINVDQGSRRRESNAKLNEFVAMFKNKTGYPIVEPAHMELVTPTIKDAFTSCVQQGADRIIISLFFLFPGRHWYQDIPSLAAEAAQGHSGVSYFVTAPLGLYELMVDVMNDRIVHCLRHIEGEGEECQVCAGTVKCRLRG